MKTKKLPEPSEAEMRDSYVEGGYCEEFLHDCKKEYQARNGDAISALHLRALSALCSFGEHNGLDCSWIYDAFSGEQKSKYLTNLKMFYLGAFAEAMKQQGASLNQTKKALKEWVGISTRHTEACHALYIKNSGFDLASPALVLFHSQVFEMASAVINNINLPYNSSHALPPYKKLRAAIKEHGYEDVVLPFECDYAERMR